MNNLDNENLVEPEEIDEHELFLNHVVGDDHDLYYLDTYLGEIFKKLV